MIVAGIALAIVVSVGLLGGELGALFGDTQVELANMHSLSRQHTIIANVAKA